MSENINWTLMRVADVPKDSAGVLVLKEGLVWMAVARGRTWPEEGCTNVDLPKMILATMDIEELVDPPSEPHVCPNHPASSGEESTSIGMMMGTHPMVRLYAGAYPETTEGGDYVGVTGCDEWNVRVSGSNIAVRGALVAAIVPEARVLEKLGSHPTQPLCFQTKRIGRLIRCEIASMKRGPEGLCPMCHMDETEQCKCEEHIPHPGTEAEERALDIGRVNGSDADAMRAVRSMLHQLDVQLFPKDGTTEGTTEIEYRTIRRIASGMARLVGLTERAGIMSGERGIPFGHALQITQRMEAQAGFSDNRWEEY